MKTLHVLPTVWPHWCFLARAKPAPWNSLPPIPQPSHYVLLITTSEQLSTVHVSMPVSMRNLRVTQDIDFPQLRGNLTTNLSLTVIFKMSFNGSCSFKLTYFSVCWGGGALKEENYKWSDFHNSLDSTLIGTHWPVPPESSIAPFRSPVHWDSAQLHSVIRSSITINWAPTLC